MPTISEFFGIIVAMFYKEHNPPHFHVRYQGQKAAIDIKTGDIIDGKISPRAYRLINEWRELHKAELLNNWDLAQKHTMPKPIEPLE